MKIIIDRFEGEYAAVEYEGKIYSLPRVFIPVGAREGDILEIGLKVDHTRTDERKKEIDRLIKDVWADS